MIKHLFVSAADDDGNPNHIQGTHWNQDHEGAGGPPQGTGNAGATGGTGSVCFYPLGPG